EVTLKATGSFAEPLEIPPLRTDDNGRAEITFEVPRLASGDTSLSLTATVVDAAGQKQTSTADRTVTSQPYRLELIPEGGSLVRGVPNRILVMTTTADGRPASVPVHVDAPIKQDLQTDEHGLGVFVVTPQEESIAYSVWVIGERGVTAWQNSRWSAHNTENLFLLRTDRVVYRGGDTMKITVLGGSEPVFVDFLKGDEVRQTLLTHTIPMKEGR